MKLALVFAALVLAVPTADKPIFGVKEGTKLDKHFETTMELEKRSMTISIGGNELPAEVTAKTAMDLKQHRVVEVEDEYRKVDGDRPLLLARHYATLTDVMDESMLMPGMEEAKDEKKEKETELADKTVLFRWNADKDEYAKEWVGDGGPDELLEGLEEDMDLRAILPGKAVAEGDTWTLDVKEFGDVLGPGGKLGFKGKDEDDDDDDGFEENLKGEATCTFKGVREEGGRKLARIAATCKATTFQDKEMKDGSSMHMDFQLELEGEFLWDVGAKHLASYEIGGDLTAKAEIKQDLEMQGQSQELLLKIDFGGKLSAEAKFTEK